MQNYSRGSFATSTDHDKDILEALSTVRIGRPNVDLTDRYGQGLPWRCHRMQRSGTMLLQHQTDQWAGRGC